MKRSILHVLSILLLASTAFAQGTVTEPISVSVPMPTPPSAAIPFDQAAVTNRAALTSLVIRHVDHIMVIISDEADASIGTQQQRYTMPFADPVKSFDAMLAVINNTSFNFDVFDTMKPVYASVYFTKGDPSNMYGDEYQALLYGSNGGWFANIRSRWILCTRSIFT